MFNAAYLLKGVRKQFMRELRLEEYLDKADIPFDKDSFFCNLLNEICDRDGGRSFVANSGDDLRTVLNREVSMQFPLIRTSIPPSSSFGYASSSPRGDMFTIAMSLSNLCTLALCELVMMYPDMNDLTELEHTCKTNISYDPLHMNRLSKTLENLRKISSKINKPDGI